MEASKRLRFAGRYEDATTYPQLLLLFDLMRSGRCIDPTEICAWAVVRKDKIC